MLPADAEYIAYEEQLIGSTPEVRATFLPYIWPTPISAEGTFSRCGFVAPGRLQMYDGPFADGYWISPAITSYLQVPRSPAVVSWDETVSPYFALAVYYRGAFSASELTSAESAWVLLEPGDTVHIRPFYQFKITMQSYRSWAIDAEEDANEFTAYAVDSSPDDYLSYALDDLSVAYIENLQLLGEYSLVQDIEEAGAVSLEAPTSFDDLVAGDHSGLLLNNRQGSFDEALAWTPAPRYSPNKSSFFLSEQDWYGLQLRIDLGWKRSGYTGVSVEEIAAITAAGDFVNTVFVTPDRAQANYEGLATGSYTSPVLTSNLLGYSLPALISWVWNLPGFDGAVYYRGADDLVTLAGAAWESVAQGDLIQVAPYCQIKLTLEGYRSWAEDAPESIDAWDDSNWSGWDDSNWSGESGDPDDPDDFTALAVDDDSDKSVSYAGGNVPGDPLTYIETLAFLGQVTDLVTLFLGKITTWGPVSRAVDQAGMAQPHTVEVYATDWIMDCLQKRIALPADDGTPAPLTFGEFLCEAEEIIGWSPISPDLAIDFDDGELGTIVESGGGACSLLTPGLTGTNGFRATVTGANQSAYGVLTLPGAGEIFVTGTMRFHEIPASITAYNFIFLELVRLGGVTVDFAAAVDADGNIGFPGAESASFIIHSYLDTPVPFALWMKNGYLGRCKLWINGDEVWGFDMDLSYHNPVTVRFGAITQATAENWIVDYDDIKVWNNYYENAFQVAGGPFDSIGPVFIDNMHQPASKTVVRDGVSYTQTMSKYPAYGMVQFSSTDPEYNTSGKVMVRVVEQAGGRHALEIIESLLASAGLTDYIDATALAAAYVACPDDIIHARFEGGGFDKQGLKDIASLGIPISDALIEIASRCLYWIFVDTGQIKIIPYTGVPPSDPVMALTSANMREASQTIDLEKINAFVTAIYGWYDRDPSLHYVAGTQEAGGQGVGLDYSWDSPVVCESMATVKAKADLLFKFLSAQELLDPVLVSLAGARLELMDSVSVEDILLHDAATVYRVTRKEVGLDFGSLTTSLQLLRVLGEN